MKPRYIAHTGKKQPVENASQVEVLFRSRRIDNGHSAGWWSGGLYNWWIHGEADFADDDIIAYRIIEQG